MQPTPDRLQTLAQNPIVVKNLGTEDEKVNKYTYDKSRTTRANKDTTGEEELDDPTTSQSIIKRTHI